MAMNICLKGRVSFARNNPLPLCPPNAGALGSILLGMKYRSAIFLFLAGACMAALATAQNPPAAAKMDPLAFVQTAADVATNLHHGSLDNYLGIYIDPKNWASGLKDGDLGPFLKTQEAKPNRSAVCLISSAKDAAVCVYFDGDKAYGATAVRAGASGKIEDKDIASGYKIVNQELLEKGAVKLRFEPSDVSTDDGAPLPAFQITVMPLL
jgi:hypothetical protein